MIRLAMLVKQCRCTEQTNKILYGFLQKCRDQLNVSVCEVPSEASVVVMTVSIDNIGLLIARRQNNNR